MPPQYWRRRRIFGCHLQYSGAAVQIASLARHCYVTGTGAERQRSIARSGGFNGNVRRQVLQKQ